MADYYWSVISARRPDNVPLMEERIGAGLVWYVAEGDGPAYEDAGADSVIEAGPLCRARNMAIDDAQAQQLPCVQMSDDFRRVKRKQLPSESVVEITAQEAADEIWTQMAGLGARLGGCSPTANPYFAHVDVKLAGFVVGDFIVVGDTDLRFDESMSLKEDYDYTAQHLARYGLVARCDLVLAEFAHRSNAGGAVAYRTADLERQMIRHLMKKWPGKFRLNPKRQNEIIMRW